MNHALARNRGRSDWRLPALSARVFALREIRLGEIKRQNLGPGIGFRKRRDVLVDAARKVKPDISIKSYGYGESERAGKELAPLLQPGDVVLVKGSQNMIRMEHFTKAIMAEPQRAKELLASVSEVLVDWALFYELEKQEAKH